MDSREEMAVPKKSEVVICSDEVESCCGSLGLSVNAIDILISRTSAIGEERSSLVPGTPDINGEFRDPLLILKSSLTRPSKTNQQLDKRTIGGDDDSPRTPKDDVFDPFAPGSEGLLRAPQCKKRFDEWRMSVARCLDFGSSAKKPGKRLHGLGNGTHMSDEEMVERVYESLLETILENKIEDILAEMSGAEWADEHCKTPTSEPKLNGVAETCPGAPLKAAAKSRNIDLSLCRKLHF